MPRMMNASDETNNSDTESDTGDESFIAPEDSDASEIGSNDDASYHPPNVVHEDSSSSSDNESDNASSSDNASDHQGGNVSAPFVFRNEPPTNTPRPVPALPPLPSPVPSIGTFVQPSSERYPKRERRAPSDVYLDNNIRRVRRVLERDERRDLIREARDWNDVPTTTPELNEAERNTRGVSTAVLQQIHGAVMRRQGVPNIELSSIQDDTDADAESDSSDGSPEISD